MRNSLQQNNNLSSSPGFNLLLNALIRCAAMRKFPKLALSQISVHTVTTIGCHWHIYLAAISQIFPSPGKPLAHNPWHK